MEQRLFLNHAEPAMTPVPANYWYCDKLTLSYPYQKRQL